MTAKITKTKPLTRDARAKSSGPSPKRSDPQATEGKVGMAPRL